MKNKKNRLKVEIMLSMLLIIAMLMSIMTSCTPKPTDSDMPSIKIGRAHV